MELPLPRGVSFRADLRLLIWQPRGVLDEAQVEALLAALEHAEDEAETPFNRYTDLSRIDLVDLRFEYIFRVSLYRRLLYANRTRVKSAFFVTNKTTASIAATHAAVTKNSPLDVKVFSKKKEAAGWLDVSLEDLEVGHEAAISKERRAEP